MGVRNYMRGRKIRKLENERDSMTVVRELETLQREMGGKRKSINFDEQLRDLNELEKQVILEERIKKLKARQQK